MQIRSARVTDAGVLSGLLSELGFPADAATVAARLEKMPLAAERVFVATEEEKVVGLLTVHVTHVLHRPTPVGRITAIVVTESARGRGVGRALVEKAEGLVAAEGCGLIELTSNVGLVDAHRFYEHLGYEVISKRFRKILSRGNQM